MTDKFFFPYPVKHASMFKERFGLINEYKDKYSGDDRFVFRDRLPDAQEIYEYFDLIKQNEYSKEYFGQLLSDNEDWKFVGAFADLDNLYKGVSEILKSGVDRAYFMTDTGGHHADNQHYELFCPINQLFFIVELLNKRAFFPEIVWIDIDAHFGNGDKKLWDSYRAKMANERNNVSGICFHNDAGDIKEVGYLGVRYDVGISEEDFLKLIQENVEIPSETKFVLLFFGTDIFSDDYGGNKNISLEAVGKLVQIFEKNVEKSGAKLIIIQTGGTLAKNVSALIDGLV